MISERVTEASAGMISLTNASRSCGPGFERSHSRVARVRAASDRARFAFASAVCAGSSADARISARTFLAAPTSFAVRSPLNAGRHSGQQACPRVAAFRLSYLPSRQTSEGRADSRRETPQNRTPSLMGELPVSASPIRTADRVGSAGERRRTGRSSRSGPPRPVLPPGQNRTPPRSGPLIAPTRSPSPGESGWPGPETPQDRTRLRGSPGGPGPWLLGGLRPGRPGNAAEQGRPDRLDRFRPGRSGQLYVQAATEIAATRLVSLHRALPASEEARWRLCVKEGRRCSCGTVLTGRQRGWCSA